MFELGLTERISGLEPTLSEKLSDQVTVHGPHREGGLDRCRAAPDNIVVVPLTVAVGSGLTADRRAGEEVPDAISIRNSGFRNGVVEDA